MTAPTARLDGSPMIPVTSAGREAPTFPRPPQLPRPARSALGLVAVIALISPFIVIAIDAVHQDKFGGDSVGLPLELIAVACSVAVLSLPVLAALLPYLGRAKARVAVGFSAAVMWLLGGGLAFVAISETDSDDHAEMGQLRLLFWCFAFALAVAPALMAWLHDGRWRWLLIGGAALAPLLLIAGLILT
jgi:hypothetical protein